MTKLEKLKKILSNMESVLFAYSGGVDSTLLLKMAKDTLGERVLAVTADSLTYPSSEFKAAKEMTERLKVGHIIIKTKELSDPNFFYNPLNRCYWCKKELFSQLSTIAKKNGMNYILDGTNYDDRRDFRPGRRAAREFGVRSPLAEARLTKREIRQLSKELDLSTWDKPAFACLASRFPYGTKITRENLKKIDEAERFLCGLGIKGSLRVRHHGSIARIEVPKENLSKLLKLRDKIASKFKELGYTYVTLDLEGYRTGSMNEPVRRRRNII
ncbi:ATP-dependent sacrificial sulfur transferase LarE [bacterium]|nr:ATP-dependent sacrificial sulfur transferase LarE [bacterium]